MADNKKLNEKLNGSEKAAILLLSLEEDLASEIMKHMGPTEVQKISSYMTKIEGFTAERFTAAAEDFCGAMGSTVASGGGEYVKKILTKALGPEKAGAIMDRIMEGNEGGGLDALRWMDPKTVANLIRDEHPQTIAVIMCYLEPEHACEVVSYLQPRLRHEVVMRVATMESVSKDAMRELEEAIKQQLSGNIATIHQKAVGGIKIAAEILNHMDMSVENTIMAEVEKINSELATKIKDQMFVFADLASVDDRGMQSLLQEVSSEHLAFALRVADEALKEKFFKNMSERAREMLQEDMETRGPVKLSEVEKIQREILEKARKLEQEGKLVIEGKGGGEVLV